MAKILITGGAGFIGSHLVEHELGKGSEVYVVDNLSTGTLDNIDDVRSHPHLHFIKASTSQQDVVEPIVRQVDRIYHLAASVGVSFIINNLVRSIENNIRGTEAILSLADKHHKKVLLTSTSEVYGREGETPFKEDSDLRMGPTAKTRWSYACSKAIDEYLAFAYLHERGLPVVVARLFNTVGQRQTDAYGMVLPTFVKQALLNRPLTIHGDGNQTRCFCHVADVVQALHRLMETDASVGQVYNVGSSDEISINELADRVIEVVGGNSQKIYIPYEDAFKVGFDDVHRRVPDISKIARLIGFQPHFSINDIITEVVTWVRQHQVVKQAGGG
jgi:UDP-glucose 4-epimerase